MISPSNLRFLTCFGLLWTLPSIQAGEPVTINGLDLEIILNDHHQFEQPSVETMRPLKLATEDTREELYRYMSDQIAELEDACDLSKQQSVRLKLAAKGAIDSSLEQWVRKIESWGWVERSGRLDRDTARRFLTNVGASESAVVRHKIWIDAVESTLTPPQRAQRSSVMSQRALTKQREAVLLVTEHLAKDFSLDPEQSRMLGQLMNDKIGRRLARQDDPQRSLIVFARFLPLDDLKTIFDEKQFQQWEDLLANAPESEPIGF